MPSGMNARPRSSTSIRGPHLRRGAGMREEGRPVCRCVRDSHYAAEYFIHKRARAITVFHEHAERARDARDRAYVSRLAPRGRCTAAITRDTRRSGVVNETPSAHSPLSFLPFCFLHLLLFCLPLRLHFPPLRHSFSSLILVPRLDLDWTFCMPTEK